ncbi:hypothetical protein IKE72_00765 [Candidatus Saccharibacteria bacterium]|nr:hypothetical protein [Candidatus Saccharibacteria bacterium]
MVNTKNKLNILLAGIVSVTSGVVAYFHALPDVSAVACSNENSANPCDINFQVNVVESLSVMVTTPQEWASGNIDTFLRNKVNLSVSTSNSSGYTASMYSKTSTNLSDGNSHTIATLGSSSTREAFPANKWGYSLGAGSDSSVITAKETDAGNTAATYAAMTTSTTSPSMIRTTANAVSNESTDIYFGAKADVTQASGTYANDVVISVVTGTVNPSTNPVTPTNPAVYGDDTTPNNNTATYVGSKNVSVASSSSTGTGAGYSGTAADDTSGDTNIKSTEVIEGNYTAPLGVTTTTTATNVVSNNNALATGLAVTAAVAATSGILFFIAGKRDDDDEEEEA